MKQKKTVNSYKGYVFILRAFLFTFYILCKFAMTFLEEKYTFISLKILILISKSELHPTAESINLDD
jgi:hypothetical protein